MKALIIPLALGVVIVVETSTVGFAEVPDAISAPGEIPIADIHAEGAQIYECKPDPGGELTWQFREPVATLLIAGKTVGRHYAGPTWELLDGSAVSGRVMASSPAGSPNDIPLLKLNVVWARGVGLLAGVTTIQRLNTKGGAVQGPCQSAGAFQSAPYSADYAFLKRGG